MFTLPVWKSLPKWSRVLPIITYLIIAITTFHFVKDTQGRRYVRLADIIRIPGIMYFLFGFGWLVLTGLGKLSQLITRNHCEPSSLSQKPSIRNQMVILGSVLLTYIISTFISWYLEFIDLQINLIVLTVIYCMLFLLLPASIGSVLLSQLFD